MSQYTVLFDANVLYPAPMRDALMQLAVTDLFKAKWTADIHREWIDALLRNEPHRERAALERTRDLMDSATRDCLVTGYEALVPALTLPPRTEPRSKSRRQHLITYRQFGPMGQSAPAAASYLESAAAGPLAAKSWPGFAPPRGRLLRRR